MLTGEKIVELHFEKFKQASQKYRARPGGPLGLDIDIDNDWFNQIDNEDACIASQPHFFKYLIDKHERYEQNCSRVAPDPRVSSNQQAP